MKNKLRFMFSFLGNSFLYSRALYDNFLDYYIRHHKIIGWYEGCPVYSSFAAPGLSKPLANLMARRMLSAITEQQLPAMANIGVTDICNARCEHCSFYNAMDKPGERVLNTEQMKIVLKQCQDFGLSVLNFVGGEPLIREDLPELIASIDKSKSVSSVYTNGWFLEKKVKALKKAKTMMVNVSLDATTPEKHDKFRRLPGLFKRAISGLRASQKEGLLTGITTTLTNEELLSGEFEQMVHFAKEQKVNELFVFDRMPVGLYSHRVDLKQNKIDKQALFNIVDKYNSKKDYPGIVAYAHIRDQSSMGCSAGRNYFYITPYGEICPCDFTPFPVGNLLNEPLSSLWTKLRRNRTTRSGEYANSVCELSPTIHSIKTPSNLQQHQPVKQE